VRYAEDVSSRVPVLLSSSSVFPEPTAAAFELAATLGYDGVEVMVWTDAVSQDAGALRGLAAHYGVPVLSIHAPCLLVTQRVWSSDPWERLRRAAILAETLGAPTVVVHPPFTWQRDYARTFPTGLARLAAKHPDVRFAVENMYPVRMAGRQFVPYMPGWDPTDTGYDAYTLDLSHCAASRSDALAMADTMGSRLAHVHLGDGTGEGRDEHLVPGRGTQPCGELLGRPRGRPARVAALRAPPPRGADARDDLADRGEQLFFLSSAVGGHVGARGAALRAEPPAAVRRGVEVDVAAALVGAHTEPGAAVFAEPDGEAPDRTGDVFGADRGAATGHVHVPVARVVAGDPRLDGKVLQQRVELGDRLDVAAGGAELEDVSQALLRPAEDGQIPLDDLVTHPGVLVAEKAPQPVELVQ
jgi:sugar phosphate isomerase/epimerase